MRYDQYYLTQPVLVPHGVLPPFILYIAHL